jgi:hypothetical protein
MLALHLYIVIIDMPGVIVGVSQESFIASMFDGEPQKKGRKAKAEREKIDTCEIQSRP